MRFFKNAASGAAPVSQDVETGRYLFIAFGTFGSASLKLEKLMSDMTTWLPITQVTPLTAAGQVLVELPDGLYRTTLTGAGATGIYADLEATGFLGEG